MAPSILIIGTHLKSADAAYRRISYIKLFFERNKFVADCIGPIKIEYGNVSRPSSICKPGFVAFETYNLLFQIINIFLAFIPMITYIMLRKPNVLIISVPDPYLVLPAYIASRIYKSKVIIDIRDPAEDYLIKISKSHLAKILAKILKTINYSIYKHVDAIVGVTNTLCYNIENEVKKKCFVIPNGADLTLFHKKTDTNLRRKLGLNDNHIVLVFIGNIYSNSYYNVLNILNILLKINGFIQNKFILLIMGKVENSLRPVLSIYEKMGIAKYLGTMDAGQLAYLLQIADIGIIPRVNDPFFDYAIPTKFYEYIASGLPVLALCRKESELAKVITYNSLGIVCEPNDIECIKESLIQLINNKDKIYKIKEFLKSYKYKIDRKISGIIYLKLVNSLLRQHNE
ncbi:MAG: glycosyltransferase [Thermoplasmata archaeon]